jgi:hypothetical protein
MFEEFIEAFNLISFFLTGLTGFSRLFYSFSLPACPPSRAAQARRAGMEVRKLNPLSAEQIYSSYVIYLLKAPIVYSSFITS